MPKKVFVTGFGIVSAIGLNASEVLASLKAGKAGIGYSNYLDTIYKDEIPVAEVSLSNTQLLELLNPAQPSRCFSRPSLLGLMAVREALKMAGISESDCMTAGLISATTVGGMDRSEHFFVDFVANITKGRMRNIAGHDCADSTETIARESRIGGFKTTISTACSSSANAIMMGARMIQHTMLDTVIVGGVDALTKFTLNGFNTLMILDRQPCRPFDDTRAGLNIGEGAAFLVLESEELVLKKKKKVYGEITGWGNACDAFHQTASSPEGTGPKLAMEAALRTAGLNPEDISYINVHGTGTPNNDLSEGIAMETVFQKGVPPFSSTKSFTGHTLGAAGSVEAVISILAIEHQLVFPNLNFSKRIEGLNSSPETSLRNDISVQHVLSNSFGFGGNNTSIILSKPGL